MNNVTADLHAALKAVCPIFGVSVGRIDDRATWRIDFDPTATDAQKDAARAALAAFNPQAAEAKRAAKARILELEAGQHRAIREAVLSGDKSRLQTIEAQIAAERAKL